MSELNPYESPKETEPQTTGQVVKRGLGVGTIILLTPVAVIITGLVTCGISQSAADQIMKQQDWGNALLIGLSIFLLPPVAVLVAMILWAVRAGRSKPPSV